MGIRNPSAPAGWATACALAVMALAACKGTSTLGAASTAAASSRRPAISVAEPRHDVGPVLEGDPVKYVFSLRNVGQDVLTIQRAQGS